MAVNKSSFVGKKVLITGGAGHIGSSLAHALVQLGANVTVLDAMLPLYGGNMFNLVGILDQIKFVEGDIRDKELVNDMVRGQDLIFDFAGQISYIDSKELPFLDLDINGTGHMNVLEAARLYAPNATYIFSSSRLVYGKLLTSPVTEEHPTRPLSLYGIHKLLAERYCDYYFKTFGLRTIVVRLPNPYGIRQQVKHNKYSLVGWFLRQALDDGMITIFGDGKQLRDYLYIDDIVEGLLLLTEKGKSGEIYNMGSKEIVTFVEMIDIVLKGVGMGKKEHIPWPENYEKNETGDYFPDTTKIKKDTGWEAKTSLRAGIQKMVDYYRKNREAYWLSGDSSIELAIRDYVNKRSSQLTDTEREHIIKKKLRKLASGTGTAGDLEKIIGPLTGKKILDAGSELGLVSLGFAKKGASITGIEDDKVAVGLAQYIAQANQRKINFIYSDLTKMPFSNSIFDAVISVDVLNRVSNTNVYLEEILRVLKPGGIALLSFPTRVYSYYDLTKEVNHLLSKHGRLGVLSEKGIKASIKHLLLPQVIVTLVKK